MRPAGQAWQVAISRTALAAVLLAWAALPGPAIAASDREARPEFEESPGAGSDSDDPAPAGGRWELIGAFEHYNELIEGEVWHDADRNEFRFELEGTRTRLKCIGAGEIDASVVQNNACREIDGDFSLHCGVQRELFGSFEYSSCGYGFAAGLDTLTGSTVAMHFGVAENRMGALQSYYSEMAGAQTELAEPEEYLASSGLDPEIYSLGTGFAITEDGYILTAAHVVDDQYGIKIHSGDRVADAEIIAIDREGDLALLKTDLTFEPLPLVEKDDAPSLAFGAMAIGYRITAGSPPVQTHESALASNVRNDRLYGFEGDIIPGYSGGPLLTVPGLKVVGVLHAISVRHSTSNWINYRITKLAYATNYDTMIGFLKNSLDAATMQKVVSRSYGPGAIYATAEPDSIVLVTVY